MKFELEIYVNDCTRLFLVDLYYLADYRHCRSVKLLPSASSKRRPENGVRSWWEWGQVVQWMCLSVLSAVYQWTLWCGC